MMADQQPEPEANHNNPLGVPNDIMYAAAPTQGPLPAFRPTPYIPSGRINNLAIASFVLGIGQVLFFGFPFTSILAVIFGHIGYSQSGKRGERGRGFALTGIILGYLGIALVIAYIAFFVLYAGNADGGASDTFNT